MNHRNLNHPNVVKFKAVFAHADAFAVAMEAVWRWRTLQLRPTAREFNESQAGIFSTLISGVEYLHNMRISHRDLKLENTLRI